jgi:hypothetical protein
LHGCLDADLQGCKRAVPCPSGDAWSSVVARGPQEALTTPALPGFSIRLGEIA